VSQHCTPLVTDGQLLWQSESVLHLSTHCFAGAGGVDDGGIEVASGAGSAGEVSFIGSESDVAHAAVKRAADRTGRMRLA
jgi:hypothetical protein